MKNVRLKTCVGFLIVGSFLLSGCTTIPMIGTPSLTLLSRNLNENSQNIKVVGDVDEEKDSLWMGPLFLFAGGKMGLSHEVVISKLLEKYKADVLLDAQLFSSLYGIPGIFCIATLTVKGKPAVFVDRRNQ